MVTRLDFNVCIQEFNEQGPNDKKGKCIRAIIDKFNELLEYDDDLYDYLCNELMLFNRPFLDALFDNGKLTVNKLYFLEYVGIVTRCETCVQDPDICCWCDRPTYSVANGSSQSMGIVKHYSLSNVEKIQSVLQSYTADVVWSKNNRDLDYVTLSECDFDCEPQDGCDCEHNFNSNYLD